MESQKIAALQEALLAQGKSWGDVMFEAEQQLSKNMSNEQKAKNAAKKVNQNLNFRIKANIQKKSAKFVSARTGVLAKIAKKCQWDCKGQKCWAHSAHVCPYIHKNQPGWNIAHAVTMKKKGVQRGETRRRRR